MRRITLLILLTLAAVNAAASSLSVRRAGTRPQIDGTLEDVWNDALVFDRFVQAEPAFGKDATVKTEVFLLFDDEYLYVAARARQPRASVRASSGRRDGASALEGDHILLAIDPQASGNSAYYFRVNAANAVQDGTLDVYGAWLQNWDARIVSATAVGDDAWTLEIAIPLSAIGLESPPEGGFGLLAGRYFAQQQETSLSSIADRNSVYRIDKFERITGLERATVRTAKTSVVPYAFGTWQSGAAKEPGRSGKAGLDVRTNPIPSMTVLATVNPDFGQIESDEPVINVTDVPTAYPEKRPFFTESSDLYPGLAVNTRNIGAIRSGLKLRQVLPTVRYDLTTILDDQHTRWVLGDARWTDNRTYHVEVIGGLKDATASRDYNVTTNLRTWFFDRRLTAYTWLGTINNHERAGNQWESVNSVKWETRTVHAGIWNHVKTELYNPNIVGSDTLSNEIIVEGWVSASYFRNSGAIREITPKIDVERHDLYSARGHAWSQATARVDAAIRPTERLGVWRLTLLYVPATDETFRYRGEPAEGAEVYRDAYSRFTLVGQRRPSSCFAIDSDASRTLSFGGVRDQKPLRGGVATESVVYATWKLRQSSTLTASFDRMNVTASPYQRAFSEGIARFRLEHTFRNGMNVRAVYQTDSIDDGGVDRRKPLFNLLVSYPYKNTTTLYLVLNDDRETLGSAVGTLPSSSARSLALKVSHALSF